MDARKIRTRGLIVALGAMAASSAWADVEMRAADYLQLNSNLVFGEQKLLVDPEMSGLFNWNNVDYAVTRSGSVAPQGDAYLGTDTLRNVEGLSGAGLTIGIISDSYNALGGASGGVASGDLPGIGNPSNMNPVTVLMDDNDPSSIDEGRAMAEIIHDIAPGANLLFHSAFTQFTGSPDQTIATAIDNLVGAGADIIVDDVGILIAPFFQDGAAAQAANNARAAGVGYYSAAGNSANNAHVGTFTGNNGDFLNFSTTATDEALDFTLDAGATALITLEWSDPYVSVSGNLAAGTAADFDLAIADSGGNIVATSVGAQTGTQDPFEFIAFTNTTGAAANFTAQVQSFSGPASGETIKLLFSGDAIVFDDDFTFSPTVFGHPGSEGATALGAQFFDPDNFVPGGGGPNNVNGFSGLGPVQILFDEDGNPVDIIRPGAELVGPDGINTTFFGSDIADNLSPLENDAFPNFFGTSAAAPHAAAVAALLMEEAMALGFALSFDDIDQLLFDTAIDLETAGFDDLSGFGRIDAPAALAALRAIPEPATGLFLMVMGSLALRRRGVTV